MSTSFLARSLPCAAVLLTVGCVGAIGDDTAPGSPGETGLQDDSLPTTAIPRLSRREIEATITDVFGLTGVAEQKLAADPKSAVNPP